MVSRFDPSLQGLWFMEEASGNRADFSANANTLTDNNTVGSSADCKQGLKSADFEEANSEYLSITDAAQTGLAITGAISICLWLKLESSGIRRMVTKYTTVGNQRAYQVMSTLTADNDIGFVLSPDGTNVTSAYTAADVVAAGTWAHVAAVYNGTDMRIYVNGALPNNGTNNPKTYSSGIYDTSAAFILGNYSGNANYMDGLLDEVAVFNRALSAAEVAKIYTAGFGNPRNLRVIEKY